VLVLLFVAQFSFAQLYSSGNNVITGNNVGVGTNTPTTSLFVKAPSFSFTLSKKISPLQVEYFDFPCSTCVAVHKTALFVKWNGLIGLLTNNPLEQIHLNGRIRGGENFGSIRLQTDFGYLRLGAESADYMHFYTDLPGFYFNKDLRVDGSIIIHNPNGLGDGNNQIYLNSDGSIRAREIKVDLEVIPDYVFKEDYNLMPLEEVKAFIEKNGHLPNVKSEAEFQEEGSISLTEMNLKLLEKVEELTLYLLQLEKRISELEKL
jgi:hypothetical protein